MQSSLIKTITAPISTVWSAFTKSVAVRAASMKFQAVRGVFSNPYDGISFHQACQLGYKGLVWVYRCINAYGDAVGSVKWVAYRVKEDGSEELLPNHPLEQLANKPNPYMARKEFYSLWGIYLMLAGESYWEVAYDSKKMPRFLYPIRPDWINAIPHPVTFINGYLFDPGGGEKPTRMENDEVVCFKFPNPENDYKGLSPLSAGMRTLETENRIINWNNSLLENNAVPGGVLSVPSTSLETTERDDLVRTLEEEYSRRNVHRPMVLWGGMQWTQMSLSQKDLDFAGLKNLTKQEIHGVLGVPEELTNANPAAKYENKAQARTMFWEDRVLPLLDWLTNTFNMRLAPLYGDGVLLRADISNHPAMIDAFIRKVNTAKILVEAGWPLNGVNRRLDLGMGDVAWGDVAWMPSSKVPVGDEEGHLLDPTNLPDPEEEEDPADPIEEPDEDEAEAEARQEDVSEDKPKKPKKGI